MGRVFWWAGVALGLLYAQAQLPAGEFSLKTLLVQTLVGAIMGAAVGATFYVPLLGDLAVLFLDYHGTPLYFTGGIGGGAGAIIGVIHSTQAVEGWVRILAALGAAVGGRPSVC